MILENQDIAFIAEMRTNRIQWKHLARVYGTTENILRLRWNTAMKRGFGVNK